MNGTLPSLYPLIKATHVALVIVSGTLFVARGMAVLRGAVWPLARRTRHLSRTIDSLLLLAALLLLLTLRLNPFATPWLLAKLGLLVLYILFGMLALRRSPAPRRLAPAFVAALLCYLMMIAIARTHDPAGFLRWPGLP